MIVMLSGLDKKLLVFLMNLLLLLLLLITMIALIILENTMYFMMVKLSKFKYVVTKKC